MIRSLSLTPVTYLLKRAGRFFLLIVCIASVYTSAIAQSTAPLSYTDSTVKQYNQQALILINNNNLDEAKPFINMALAQKENAVSYYYLCHIYAIENEWDSSIKSGEKAERLDSGFLPLYSDLLLAYTKEGDWSKAEEISDQARRGDTNGSQVETLKALDESIANDSRSKILLTLFLFALGSAFLFPLFTAKNKVSSLPDNNTLRFSEIVLISASVSCFFWLLFEASVHWIWSFNPRLQSSLFTPMVKMFVYERDGIESFILYTIMLACIGATVVLSNLLLKLRNKNGYLAFFTVLFLVTAYYFYHIGFVPPMYELGEDDVSKFPEIFILLAIISAGAYFLYDRFSIIIKIVLVLLIAYTSLVMIYPSSIVDLSFILYPALRLMHGAKITEIYFQYDMLLSFLAYAWMKLNFSLDTFAYLTHVSYFIFFVASFFFADRLFKSKWLSVLFITALVIIRYYGIWDQGADFLQVSPLRLDLWIIPLIIAYYKGVHHWLVGIALGLLVIFHRNLGIIYVGAYAELVIVLFVLDMIPAIVEHQSGNASKVFIRHLKLNAKNVLILLASVALCLILFKEMFSQSALIYRKIGVGMLRISKFSFYWYVPVMVGCLAVLLYRFRQKLGERYSETGMFIVLLLVGNSMYFFGRSHENNIINISALLILALFVLFDILICLSPKEAVVIAAVDNKNKKKDQKAEVKKGSLFTKRTGYIALPFLFLFMSGYYYSGRLAEKFDQQYDNFTASQYICPLTPMTIDTTAIQHITLNSPNVFFLNFYIDFYYYYYGHYAPLGYFNPMSTWIYRKDLLNFIQDLLDKHYYIVYNTKEYQSLGDYIPYLNYDHSQQENNMVALSRENVSLLLSQDTSEIFHKAFKDTIARNGVDFANTPVKDSFTIEVVVKPTGTQVQNATILSDFNKINALTGFVLQANGTMPSQYLFGYGSGQAMPTMTFLLEDNKWNDVVITGNKDAMRVYVNGKLLVNNSISNLPIINSELPLTIGNSANRDVHFSGDIKEVKVSNGNIDEATITNNWQKLETELP